jgi:hypothetical protein
MSAGKLESALGASQDGAETALKTAATVSRELMTFGKPADLPACVILCSPRNS